MGRITYTIGLQLKNSSLADIPKKYLHCVLVRVLASQSCAFAPTLTFMQDPCVQMLT